MAKPETTVKVTFDLKESRREIEAFKAWLDTWPSQKQMDDLTLLLVWETWREGREYERKRRNAMEASDDA